MTSKRELSNADSTIQPDLATTRLQLSPQGKRETVRLFRRSDRSINGSQAVSRISQGRNSYT